VQNCLLGAVETLGLPNSGIGFHIPIERLYHIGGTSREDFQPVLLNEKNIE
jgi:hypothetical protein